MQKHILGLLLLAAVTTGTLYYHLNSEQKGQQSETNGIFSDTIIPRTFEEAHSQKHIRTGLTQSDENTVNLKYKSTVDLLVNKKQSNGQEEGKDQTSFDTECTVVSKFNKEQNTFQLTIGYSQVSEHFEQNQMDDELASENFNTSNVYFYKATVDAKSGEILEMQKPKDGSTKDTIQWATEELIYSIIPDLRKSTFENSPVEQDTIGEYKSKNTQDVHDDDHLNLEKSYNHADYLSHHNSDYNPPKVNFNRSVKISKQGGLVKSGQTTQNFEIGEQNFSDDLDVSVNDIIGYMQVNIDHKFNFAGVEQDESLLKEMEDFSKTQEFEIVTLTKEKRVQIEHPEQQQQEKLQGGQVQFQKGVSLINFNVLSQNVEVKAEVISYNDEMVAQGNLYVNSRKIATFVQASTKKCVSYNKNWSGNQHMVIFKMVWSVGGLVNLPVTATTQLDYGYVISSADSGNECSMNISPNVSATLMGTGKASLAGTINAGIYAKGKFLDTTLTLSASYQKSNLATNLKFSGQLIGVQFEFGGVYRLLTCDSSKLLHFQWASACQIGDDVFKPFVQKATRTMNKTFWQKQVFGGLH